MYRLYEWLKKYFIPEEGNDHEPHFLGHKSMMLFFLTVIVIELGFLVQVFIVFDKTNFLAAVLPGVLTKLTNEERALNDAPPLAENDLLERAAKLKAEDMAAHGYFAHTSPDGKSPWYWLDQVGYRFVAAGENLAVNFFESEDVAEAWMNSPSHRANIVKKDYTEIGIGVAKGVFEGRNTVFVVQFFGTPLKISLPPPAPVQVPKPIPAPAPKPIPTPTVMPTQLAQTPAPATQVLGEEQAVSTTGQSIKSFFQKILTSPRESVAYVYGGIGLIVTLALLLYIFIRHEIHHPAILVRGMAMIAIIFLLLFINIKVVRPHTEVPRDNLTANVIAY